MLGLVCYVFLNHSKVPASRYLEIFQMFNPKTFAILFFSLMRSQMDEKEKMVSYECIFFMHKCIQ